MGSISPESGESLTMLMMIRMKGHASHLPAQKKHAETAKGTTRNHRPRLSCGCEGTIPKVSRQRSCRYPQHEEHCKSTHGHERLSPNAAGLSSTPEPTFVRPIVRVVVCIVRLAPLNTPANTQSAIGIGARFRLRQ
jgi:hypothetical protein